nr:PAS domain S-box protein [Siccirubricoccus soli]
MNEELQSSNEELETSKEEVQAANAALAAANADLENLLNATRIATIFLDREGRVRGFTPAAAEIYPVTAQDIGRPLAHLRHRLRDLPPLPDLAEARAATEGTPVEHEAESEDGRWFLRRVLPYRGPGDGADGLVVTFLDITRRKTDERALREAEERLRLSQEAGGIGTWDWEVGTQQVHWSDQIPRLLGLCPAVPPSHRAFLERVHPDDRAALEAALEAAADGRVSDLRAEFRVLRGDTGELRWVATRGEVERAAVGRPLRMRGVALDVTEQRAAETALRESEARLRDLLATLDLGAFMARDLDGTIRFWSAGSEHLYGWAVAEAVGQDAHELLRTVFPVPRAEISTVLERDGEWIGDLRQRTRDGVEIVVTAHKVLRRGPDGRSMAVLESLTDVTAQRRAEAALAQSEARLRAAVEGSPIPIMLHAEDGEVLALSRSWMDLSGYGPEEIPTHSTWLRLAYPDRYQETEALLKKEFAAGKVVQTGEKAIRTRSGEGRIWDVQAVLLGRLSDGRQLWMSAAVDVTERKRTEEQQLLLAREVDHRARNALAVVQSLLRLTPAKGDETKRFASTVADRVAAVARAHGLLSRERWVGAELREIIEEELAPYAMDAPSRTRLAGPQVRLSVNAALSLSMVLHELATNAAKHGAFSVPGGQVAVAWAHDPVNSELRVEWREIGGPPIAAPPPSDDRTGGSFGSRLIARTVRQLGGSVEFSWDPTGLHCTLRLPVNRLGAAAVRDAAGAV